MRIKTIVGLLGMLVPATFGATPNIIGAMNAVGTFHMNGTKVTNHASLPEGAMIETGIASGEIDVVGGTHLVLSGDAKARVHHNAISLLGGAAQVERSTGYSLEVNGLRIRPTSNTASVAVAMNKTGVRVSALRGPASVSTSNGALLATVQPGTALFFDEQAGGASQTIKVTGKVTNENGHYYIVDSTTGVKVELQGDVTDAGKSVGKLAEAQGTLVTEGGKNTLSSMSVRTIHGVDSVARTAAFVLGTKSIIAGVGIAGAGAAIGIVKANEAGTPLSK